MIADLPGRTGPLIVGAPIAGSSPHRHSCSGNTQMGAHVLTSFCVAPVGAQRCQVGSAIGTEYAPDGCAGDADPGQYQRDFQHGDAAATGCKRQPDRGS